MYVYILQFSRLASQLADQRYLSRFTHLSPKVDLLDHLFPIYFQGDLLSRRSTVFELFQSIYFRGDLLSGRDFELFPSIYLRGDILSGRDFGLFPGRVGKTSQKVEFK